MNASGSSPEMCIYRASDKMRDMIADNTLLLSTLSRFGISLGFGDMPVDEVCRMNGVDTGTFLAVANLMSHKNFQPEDVNLESLIGYLKQAHAYFLDFILPGIRRTLIEALSASESNDLTLLILKYFDEYSDEVRNHMDMEDREVFTYVARLLNGEMTPGYSISSFLAGHRPIAVSLKNLKDVIICHYPGGESNVNLLNNALFDIIVCERDLLSHCEVEDRLFVPAVKRLEDQIDVRPPSRSQHPADSAGNMADLTEREKEIIACVARGLSNKEIATRLCLSVHTVTTHRRNVAAKLDIHSSSGLTIFAIINNLIDLKDVKLTQ